MVNTNDFFAHLGDLTIKQNTGFYINDEDKIAKFDEIGYNFRLTYSISTKRHKYVRTVYSLFDLLADVGGLLSAFTPINSIVILLF